jgi:ubiquinol-cytochrome c reductase cytochrome c subunit
VGGRLVAPRVTQASPREIAEAMLTAPGNMPLFGPRSFTPHEVDSIVRYVRFLDYPPNRGGAAIGHVGPVAEGAVGWIVGLGALVLFVRWIAARSGQHA